ncbi:hypothetical protein L593_10045 [Salinarchaeum sp. Harcht-Bsk1]|nr:hypothetical protein L593_10045 [Salinarchaeum sp. Harcht-Bsk1]
MSEEPRDSERDRGGDGDAPDASDGPQWRSRLEAQGELTPDVVEDVLAAHGDRGSRAIDAVGEGRVKQYQDFTVVVGNSDEYVVEDGACTCKDATYNLDPEDPRALCWHALAAEIARAVGALDHHDMYYSEVRDFI